MFPRLSCHQGSGGDLDSAKKTQSEIWKTEGKAEGARAVPPAAVSSWHSAFMPSLWQSDLAFGIMGQLLYKEQFTQLLGLSFKAKETGPAGLEGHLTSAFLATLRTPRIILFPAHTPVQTLNIKCMTLSSQQEHVDFNYLYSFKNTKFRWY